MVLPQPFGPNRPTISFSFILKFILLTASFDLYDLLIRGDRSKDLTIEAGDTLLINAASQFVEISGAVKRPGIYEILEGETLEDIADFALGFTQTANKSNISVSFLDLKKAAIVKKNINTFF